ncbi:MAG: hypothetical protein FJX29_14095 [Alphaproteobacteria bacterium]|nr:hypothetical protein [Alphaproteobacteria bacterium]
MAAGWSQQFINYCERAGHGFWDEPLNAITNLAFQIAAGAISLLLRKADTADWPVAALALVAAATGAGTFLFHTFATRWALLADVIPIAMFIYGYLFLALRRFLRLQLAGAIILLAVFAGLNILTQAWGGRVLNSSFAYLPALLAILSVAAALVWQSARSSSLSIRNRRIARRLLLASALFAVSLFFRTIDRKACAIIPAGTHFLWHILNAVLLYWLLRIALEDPPPHARRDAAIM